MSPIPLGFWATAGASAAVAGSYELISTAYGTGSSDTITFSSIPQTYKHLQFRCVVKTTASAAARSWGIRLNNQSGVSYRSHFLRGYGSVQTADAGGGNDDRIRFDDGIIGSTTGYTNIYTGSIIDILDYSSTLKNSTTRNFGGFSVSSTEANRVFLASGMIDGTGAVSTVSFIPQGAGDNITSASRISLYGIKG